MRLPQTPSFRLNGKRALVAGASLGIGRAGAVALGQAGAQVTLLARGLVGLEALADEMIKAGMNVRILQIDITDIGATQEAIALNGPFDVLLNSAGTARHAPVSETLEQDFNAVVDLNVRGAYFITQAVAKGLIKAGKAGSLINISSQMAHVGGPDRAVYCASKHAVEGFTKAMAIDWGKFGIRVNTICPTFILTELTRPTFDDPQKRAWIESNIALGRVGEVEDIMGAVVYLASDASSLVTGTSLVVDGGWTAQ